MWDVIFSDEYAEWFGTLDGASRTAVYSRVLLLREFGPELARPYADTLKGSRIPNLKELRAPCKRHVYRVLYVFDPERRAFLLVGGDKRGRRGFYRQAIREAERIYFEDWEERKNEEK